MANAAFGRDRSACLRAKSTAINIPTPGSDTDSKKHSLIFFPNHKRLEQQSSSLF